MARCFLTLALLTGSALATSVIARQNQALPPAHAAVTGKTPKTWTVSRTPWGDPDLQGVYTNIDELNIPLERPDRFEGREVGQITEADLRAFAKESNEARRRAYDREENLNRNVTATARNRYDLKPSRPWLVVDPPAGKIPLLTPEARRRIAAGQERQVRLPDSYEDLSAWYRCISLGLPRSMMPTIDEQAYRIVQAPGVVAITYEMVHEARIIPLEPRAHVGAAVRSYMGDTRGHWEGSSLLVETTNFNDPVVFSGYSTPDPLASFPPGASKDLHLVERFTPTAPNRVEWSVTFVDPSAWARPWTIAMNLTKTDESQQAFEYACHESNLALSNLLTSAHVDERRAQNPPK